MSTFEIDTEIDKLVDKLTDQFKTRLKKLVTRSEKLVLKQYIASQKETLRVTRSSIPNRKQTKTRSKTLKDRNKDSRKVHARVRKKVIGGPLRRERDYQYQEHDSADSLNDLSDR